MIVTKEHGRPDLQVGEADVLGQMSGSGVTFLFPDHTTALTGTFCKSEMLLGQVSFIQVRRTAHRSRTKVGRGCHHLPYFS